MIANDVVSPLERLIRRDRLIVTVGLAVMTLLAWTYLLRIDASMRSVTIMDAEMMAMGMPDIHVWGAADWIALFVMWTAMMVGMMLPSAAPVILLLLGMYRRRGDQHAQVSAFSFVAGYLAMWTTFSALAASAQVALHRAALLGADMISRSMVLAGAILLVAGVYQWLPIKKACLTHCQSPLAFLATHWREGSAGAFRMGLHHGAFCVGCCWAFMALLFVIGVMNLWWVTAIAAFVLVEKLAPQGTILGRVAGGLLIAWGIFELARGLAS